MDKENTRPTDDNLSQLIRAAYKEPQVPREFESKVMLEVARRSIKLSRRKAKLGLVASLSGLAMLLAGCIAILVNWLPGRLLILEDMKIPKPEGWLARFIESSPFMVQWGGWLFIGLLAGGAAGFIYYLNSLFSNSDIPE